jgi:hypothetical protein
MAGAEMLETYKKHPYETSILDDFNFYEKKQENIMSKTNIDDPMYVGVENSGYLGGVILGNENLNNYNTNIGINNNRMMNESLMMQQMGNNYEYETNKINQISNKGGNNPNNMHTPKNIMQTSMNNMPNMQSSMNNMQNIPNMPNMQSSMNNMPNMQSSMNNMPNMQPSMNNMQNMQPSMNNMQNMQNMQNNMSNPNQFINPMMNTMPNFDNNSNQMNSPSFTQKMNAFMQLNKQLIPHQKHSKKLKRVNSTDNVTKHAD